MVVQEREGSLNTSASGLAGGMQIAGAMAYQADAEGEGSGSDPAGVLTHACPFAILCTASEMCVCQSSKGPVMPDFHPAQPSCTEAFLFMRPCQSGR